jgi:hypothetical protein
MILRLRFLSGKFGEWVAPFGLLELVLLIAAIAGFLGVFEKGSLFDILSQFCLGLLVFSLVVAISMVFCGIAATKFRLEETTGILAGFFIGLLIAAPLSLRAVTWAHALYVGGPEF